MSKKWFQTWSRPEYQEWAVKTREGYLLHIIRKEKDGYLCVKAKLIMGEKGLPGFEVIEEYRFSSKNKSVRQIQIWKEEL